MDVISQLSGAATNVSPEQVMQVQSVLFAMAWVVPVILILILLIIITNWMLFKKAGRKGYESLVPGHNVYELITLSGRPGRRIFLLLVPYVLMMIGTPLTLWTGSTAIISVVGIITILFIARYIIDLNIQIGRRFAKSGGFIFGLIILPIIFYPILAFGKSVYTPK